MDLAIVTPFPPTITGISQYGFHLSRALAQSCAFSHITILAGSQQPGVKASLPGPTTVEFAWRQESYSAGQSILARLERLQPDLVWYNLGASIFGRSPLANLVNLVRLGLGQMRGFPCVVTLHELIQLADLRTLNAPGGRLARFGAGILMNAAARADVVCLTTRRYADWFAVHRPDLAHEHIPIGAYNLPELLPESGRQELLFFTTHAPFKGLDILLDAYRSLLARYPGLRMTIAGAEHPRFPGYLESVRQRMPAALPGIRWLGPVPDSLVRSLFEGAQIVVLPYQASTGSSSVVFQAAAWGRPVVASNIPDICAMAEENDLEMEFFQRGSPAALAAAIQTLLERPHYRRSQAQHNFALMQGMGPGETCRRYLQAFNLALETRQSPERLFIPAAPDLEYC